MSSPARVDALTAFRDLTREPAVAVVVSDLDGVLRRFPEDLWPSLDAELGLTSGRLRRIVLRHPILAEVSTGRATHRQWREAVVATLAAEGIAPQAAEAAVQRWATTPATIDPAVQALLREAEGTGRPVFVLTNGTDQVRAELTALGLGELAHGDRLLNSAELGAAKPDPEAYARALARIEAVLGRRVEPATIAFLDDGPGNVTAARAAGWQAVHLPAH